MVCMCVRTHLAPDEIRTLGGWGGVGLGIKQRAHNANAVVLFAIVAQ